MISNEDFAQLEKIFITRKECDGNQDAIYKKLNSIDVRSAVLENQQKINNWLTVTIVGGIIALLIKVFVGG
ncbi:MAG: hypothetical protein IKU30_06040 [Clostridia bacterium]|nr:hypothetical protein [Clostridia bacterium]MBR6447834.1 hypothetical protein [Methanomicrobium sp.]